MVAMTGGISAKPFTRVNCCSQYRNTVPSHRWSIMLPRVCVIFRSLCRTKENMLSIGLVDSSLLRSSAGTFSRCSVYNSSKASRSESAADSFLVHNHASSSSSICLASA